MNLVFLWTDLLLWLLLLLGLTGVIYTRKRRHLLEPWQQVFRNKVAMASALILSVFIVIGLLDSIHYRTDNNTQDAGQIISLFDTLVPQLRHQHEKSYSAPFALYLYSKETLTSETGKQQRVFPRLNYAGAHLEDDSERFIDILWRMLLSLFETILLITIFYLLIILRRTGSIKLSAGSYQELIRSDFPWFTFIGTLAVISFCIFSAINLSSAYHILGTDKVGEDVFYQALKSIRTGLVLGTLTTLIMLPAAILLGVMAGYFRGWIDDVIQYLYTTLNSIPGVLLIAAMMLMLQVYIENNPQQFASSIERADMRLLFLCIILGITSWTGLCRLLRGEALKIRELEYVQAAQAFGVSNFKILMRHLVPNVMHIVLIIIVLDFSGLVLAEAVLSYINIGVDPTTNSWGNMINSARLEMAREPIVWWSLVAAFVFMFTLVLAANLFSDAVRDAFDPHLRESL